MLITETLPVWSLMLCGIFALLCIALLVLDEIQIALFTVAGLWITLMLGSLIPATTSYSNPYYEPAGISISAKDKGKADKEEINKFIKETLDVDAVSVKINDEIGSKDARSGEIFEFTGIDDGSKIDGSFYFTEKTMEIIVESKEEIKEQFSVELD